VSDYTHKNSTPEAMAVVTPSPSVRIVESNNVGNVESETGQGADNKRYANSDGLSVTVAFNNGCWSALDDLVRHLKSTHIHPLLLLLLRLPHDCIFKNQYNPTFVHCSQSHLTIGTIRTVKLSISDLIV
jgi:hypothetical protein